MKKNILAIAMVVLLLGIACGEGRADSMNSIGALITPIGSGRIIVNQRKEDRDQIDVSFVSEDTTYMKETIQYDINYFIPISAEGNEPIILLKDSNEDVARLIKWTKNDICLLRELEKVSTEYVKPEGTVLKHYNAEKLNCWYEFIDLKGNTIFNLEPNGYFDKIVDIEWDQWGWLFLTSGKSKDEGLRKIFRLSKEGTIQWECEVWAQPDCNKVFADGKGGGWISYSQEYAGDEILLHINRAGIIDVERKICSGQSVKDLNCSVVDNNGISVLYGTSVSRSRNIYHVFAISIDELGRVIELDVREFEYYGDYSYVVKEDGLGNAYVCSLVLEDRTSVAIPFVELKKVSEPDMNCY